MKFSNDSHSLSQYVSNYTINQIKKAGKRLKENKNDIESLKILGNWRESHFYPMQYVGQKLQKISMNIDSSAIVTQRLKRAPAIIEKLKRFPNMSLVNMQDIAGCRIIVKNIDHQYEIVNEIKNAFKIKTEKDYVKNPKSDGYRSIHLICELPNELMSKFDKQTVEIQIRTKIQHFWATTLETIDIIEDTSMKTGKGEEKWMNFFKDVSDAFAKYEQGKDKLFFGLFKNSYMKIKKQAQELDLRKKLSKLKNIAINKENVNESKDELFILELDYNKKTSVYSIKIDGYKSKSYLFATNKYLLSEKNLNKNRNIVFVRARNLSELKIAYPNYHANVESFLKLYKEIIGWN